MLDWTQSLIHAKCTHHQSYTPAQNNWLQVHVSTSEILILYSQNFICLLLSFFLLWAGRWKGESVIFNPSTGEPGIGRSLWAKEQPCLHSKLQANQGYIVRSCLKKGKILKISQVFLCFLCSKKSTQQTVKQNIGTASSLKEWVRKT